MYVYYLYLIYCHVHVMYCPQVNEPLKFNIFSDYRFIFYINYLLLKVYDEKCVVTLSEYNLYGMIHQNILTRSCGYLKKYRTIFLCICFFMMSKGNYLKITNV